jgi:hypothetical protein
VQRGVEELIAIDPHGGYLRNSLVEALTKVGRETYRCAQTRHADRRRLLMMLPAIEGRITDIVAAAQKD